VVPARAGGLQGPWALSLAARSEGFYVRAHNAAELDDRMVSIRQLSDAELNCIAMGGNQTDGTPTLQPVFFEVKADLAWVARSISGRRRSRRRPGAHYCSNPR
jgi:hypothetical protein